MITLCVALLPLISLGAALPAEPAADARPNVVFILADDWGWGDVGIYNGDPRARTPRLDQMGRQGTVFTDFHVANPVCSPSRTAFMTGRHPATLKIHTALTTNHSQNAARGCADYLPTDIPTLTLLLQGAGYDTGHFGKWHLGRWGRQVCTIKRSNELQSTMAYSCLSGYTCFVQLHMPCMTSGCKMYPGNGIGGYCGKKL